MAKKIIKVLDDFPLKQLPYEQVMFFFSLRAIILEKYNQKNELTKRYRESWPPLEINSIHKFYSKQGNFINETNYQIDYKTIRYNFEFDPETSKLIKVKIYKKKGEIKC
uniref:DUF2963 domain-containing protein n=1 Tax='Rehmannia glutinosa' phytoplasma TaxID=167955 RepID=D6BQX2_9MOLU|nr:hypothetical protein ['Rehmannia glutinosa' phytoplasma]ADA63496.1 unknown ['Rehmannia glutinosa' phytoplasma]